MAINRGDLKIFKPELLGSSDDAGGQRTKNEVESGKLNELFRAISDIDHAQSAVDIVKCYPALDTPDTSILLDGHVFISQKPTDPLVSMLIAESDDLGDADRMTDMVEILESSVKAGQLIRNRLVGMLAGQDTFPRQYLQTNYMFNGKEYWNNITLQQGQTVVISVEYQGNENANWPRFEHFCEIQKSVTGTAGSGNVEFKPPIPYDTPDANVIINGETGCTKLRYTSDNDGIKYHGVSALTAENTDNSLTVESTETELLPKIRTTATKSGNKIPGVTDFQGSDGSAGLTQPAYYRKSLAQPYISGKSTYIFDVNDVLQDDFFSENGISNLAITGSFSNRGSVSVTNGQIVVIFDVTLPPGWNVGVTYASIDTFSVYDSANAFPANKAIVKQINTLAFGSITFVNTAYGVVDVTFDKSDSQGISKLREPNGNVIGELDVYTGALTKITDFRGDYTLSYDALLTDVVDDGQGNPVPPGNTETSFSIESPDYVTDSLYILVSATDGSLLSGSSDVDGNITGAGVTGTVDNGFVALTFSQPVWLTQLTYDYTEIVTLSPPPELYGLNPLRIKNGGLVESFTAWNTISIQNTQTQAVTNPAPAQTYNVRANARFVDITDADGKSLWTVTDTHYSVNKETGVVTINSDFTGFTAPFLLTDSIGETALVTDVQDKKLILAAELSQTYPIGSVVSSIQNLGDMQARVGTVRDMTSWNNNWDLDGTPATASMNVVDYPIEVVNDTAINEDWVLIFTSSTAYRCVGRRIGQVATGDTVSDFAPMNPLTQAPYFVIRSQAFGGGWNTGEAVRFRTYASANPIMMLRTVQSGHSQITTDRAVLSFRGNES